MSKRYLGIDDITVPACRLTNQLNRILMQFEQIPILKTTGLPAPDPAALHQQAMQLYMESETRKQMPAEIQIEMLTTDADKLPCVFRGNTPPIVRVIPPKPYPAQAPFRDCYFLLFADGQYDPGLRFSCNARVVMPQTLFEQQSRQAGWREMIAKHGIYLEAPVWVGYQHRFLHSNTSDFQQRENAWLDIYILAQG